MHGTHQSGIQSTSQVTVPNVWNQFLTIQKPGTYISRQLFQTFGLTAPTQSETKINKSTLVNDYVITTPVIEKGAFYLL